MDGIVSKDACIEKHKAIEHYLEVDQSRLDQQSTEIKTMQEAMFVLTSLQSRHDNDLRDHETRIRGIEARPGKHWDGVTTQVISLVVAAIAGVLIGRIV